MSRIITIVTVFGATGYTGQRIVAELLARSISVTGVARDTSQVPDRIDQRLNFVTGDLNDGEFRRRVSQGNDAIVLAVPPRLENGQRVAGLVPEMLAEAQNSDHRLGIVGGAGSLWAEEGGPRVMDQAHFPEALRPTAEAHAKLLDALTESTSDAEWFYLSPPTQYGARFPGRKTGAFRLGKDVLLRSEAGSATISSEDYAKAFVDELLNGRHLRKRFTVGY